MEKQTRQKAYLENLRKIIQVLEMQGIIAEGVAKAMYTDIEGVEKSVVTTTDVIQEVLKTGFEERGMTTMGQMRQSKYLLVGGYKLSVEDSGVTLK